MNALMIAAHTLAATVWVGGMFFAYIVLRPAAVALDPPLRLSLWAGVFQRFFPWVWLIVLVLLVSGYGMIFGIFKGFANAHSSIHIMQLLGLVMMGLFVFLFHKPYKTFKLAVSEERWPDAAAALNKIRQVILVNLILGFVVIAVAVSGRYW